MAARRTKKRLPDMERWAPVAVVLPFVLALTYSGYWAARRYARFDELPGHYGFDGEPTRMAPRRVMVWMLPVIFGCILAMIAALAVILPREVQNGDPVVGALLGGVGLLGGQVFVLWLTERWARKQP